jgi:allantoinase
MNSLDLIIRGGTVVTDAGAATIDLGIAGEKIVAMGETIDGVPSGTIDASGLHLFPGVIDAHVHFNEPGRAEWEGFDTGSRAVAAGGGTLYFDMPLNAHPPTNDAACFMEKEVLAESQSSVDYAFWGGLVPGNLDRLAELADCGVVGFKAFMSNSGIDDFQSVDDRVLHEGMKRAAFLKVPVAVHAESDTMTARLATEAIAAGRTTARDYLNSRPILAELDAIQRAIDLAAETGCSLHVVHVTCAAGVGLVAGARKAGVDVTCETCPHYLVLTEEDVETLGAVAKCAPPLRTKAERELLWREVLSETVSTIGSDHSPAPPEIKQASDFFKVWGGISGAQHLLPLLLTAGHFERQADLSLLSRYWSANVARRFRLPPAKGRIAVGCDADIAFVKLDETRDVLAGELQYRHRQSPYVGRSLRGVVKRTMLRGRTVFLDGAIVAGPAGKLIRPLPA